MPVHRGSWGDASEPDDLSVVEAAERLGLSTTQIRAMIRRDHLYAHTVRGRLHLPAWQFTPTGVLPHLREFLTGLPADLHPWTVSGFMHVPSDELDGKTPVAWLSEDGAVEPVLFAATALTHW